MSKERELTCSRYTSGGEALEGAGHADEAQVKGHISLLMVWFGPSDQLKAVMEQVLDFAMCELKKIVEASFDDLLLEITKKEHEQQALEDRLDKRGGGARSGGRRGSENDSVSPSGSEDARKDPAAVTDDPARQLDLSVSQDWVPILDKVFGQKWCGDVWQVKESSEGRGGDGGHSSSEGDVPPPPVTLETLEPSPSSPQQDPRWTPLEDMDVFSPDEDAGGGARPSPVPPLSPSGRRSSASMLQRLLTLPSQLLDDGNPGVAHTKSQDVKDPRDDDVRLPEHTSLLPLTTKQHHQQQEDEEEEEKTKKKRRRKVRTECDDCGRMFSHVTPLCAHPQSHGGVDSPLQCSECGKRFPSTGRLGSHLEKQHCGPGVKPGGGGGPG
ncbi:uncharacterized protein si:dkeyp-113d7.10 isoform X2 [Dunckerocampus dactyliophorus]|uniref:uncharacterized protein si:dkeyp-113d7.10 isoform X2 n=1 Tax=Dunckerocampus dactyliophorus TaxID=161453 RepID=UPI0024054E4E|nr:uncharacterized protein si:dkeyp-113d7.10 isoform X2 [Dunckerocampus dactyliophorus]